MTLHLDPLLNKQQELNRCIDGYGGSFLYHRKAYLGAIYLCSPKMPEMR